MVFTVKITRKSWDQFGVAVGRAEMKNMRVVYVYLQSRTLWYSTERQLYLNYTSRVGFIVTIGTLRTISDAGERLGVAECERAGCECGVAAAL